MSGALRRRAAKREATQEAMPPTPAAWAAEAARLRRNIKALMAANVTVGRIQEQNFNTYPILRIPFAPDVVEAYFIESEFPPTGMGEPAMAPAVANAIFAATGERLRAMPFQQFGYKV